jgi:dihydrofolate reductase
VAAAARNAVIGHAGEIPWRLPDDQRFFRRLTLGHCVLMGRKTFDSMGKALPGRINLVLSRSDLSRTDGVRGFTELAESIEWARVEGCEELFVIGGEALYRDTMDQADRIYLTRVDAEPAGDVFFPEIDATDWECVATDEHEADDRHAHAFVIETWNRRV